MLTVLLQVRYHREKDKCTRTREPGQVYAQWQRQRHQWGEHGVGVDKCGQGVQTIEHQGWYKWARDKCRGVKMSMGCMNEHEGSARGLNKHREYEWSTGEGTNEHRGVWTQQGQQWGLCPPIHCPPPPPLTNFFKILLLFKHIYIFPCTFNTIFRIF